MPERPLLWAELRDPLSEGGFESLHRLAEEPHHPFFSPSEGVVYYTLRGQLLAVPLNNVRRMCLAPVDLDEGADG